MARSRYAGNRRLDDGGLETWRHPNSKNPLGPDMLEGVPFFEHVFCVGDRLDLIAHRYLGDAEYWWVVSLVNGVIDPFGLSPGQILKIPADVKVVLDRIQR